MKKGLLIALGLILVVIGGSYFYQNEKKFSEVSTQKSNNIKKGGEEIVPESSSNISFGALTNREYGTPAVNVGEVIATTKEYKKHAATYKSDDLTISGVLYIPNAPAPAEGYPVFITNHGHIDTTAYTTGRGLKREQEYFASRGYVVFHPDYRNHAGSSKTEDDPIQDRLGYIIDIIHAVEALKSSDLPINENNITLLGHSMGGGATLAAALVKPDIAKRIVLYAPVTVNSVDSYKRWQSRDLKQVQKIKEKYGLPEENPQFWEGLNGEPYYERLGAPVQIYHGTRDQDVPYDWALKIRNDLQNNGKQVELITYDGEGHEFSFAWTHFMESVEAFIKR